MVSGREQAQAVGLESELRDSSGLGQARHPQSSGLQQLGTVPPGERYTRGPAPGWMLRLCRRRLRRSSQSPG